MTSLHYYDQNPSEFCFFVQIRAFVIQTSLGLRKGGDYERRNEKDSGHSNKVMPWWKWLICRHFSFIKLTFICALFRGWVSTNALVISGGRSFIKSALLIRNAAFWLCTLYAAWMISIWVIETGKIHWYSSWISCDISDEVGIHPYLIHKKANNNHL